MIYDVAIVGAGIAGVSLAAELAPHVSVVVIEAEDTPAYHATGRSAAFWHETLGGPVIQPLTTWSRAALDAAGALRERFSLNVATDESLPLLDALEAEFAGTAVKLRRLDDEGVRQLVPRAAPVLAAGIVEEDCADIDVALLHADMLRRFRKAGGRLTTGFRVARAAYERNCWQLRDDKGAPISAKVLVDAAGAWADELAVIAGVKPLGIQPMRRTIVQVRVDGDDVPPDGPLTIDVAGQFYFKPEGANRFWICPHDETPVAAHDVAPEDIDVATAIDRFETVTNWRVVAVERKWAGLRSFAPDRLPVFGFTPEVPAFFWCAGQGGVGIQTAPAAARLCASLILPDQIDALPGVDVTAFAPARFA